jgi:TonB-like protein
MLKLLRAGISSCVAAVLIAVFATLPVEVHSQTRDSPLRLYENGPAPRKVKTVIPKYPPSAQSGSIILELTLRPDGKVDAVKAIRPLRGATQAAIAAVKKWKYEPVLFKGKPAWAIIDIIICNPWRCRPSITPRKSTV